MSVHAAAKINLFLHITGRRDNGYHELDSLVGFTAFGDQVVVESAHDISLRIEGPFGSGLPVNDENLVLAAARMFADEVGRDGGTAITLQKNLPVSSGIGGGSADAAATLHALNQLWDAGATPEILAAIGLRLGADVPVCLLSMTARMSGVGEVVRPVGSLPNLGVLLINPGVPVSTPQVFKARVGSFSKPVAERVPDAGLKFCEFVQSQRNDLQDPAIELEPQIAKVLQALSDQSTCRLSRLSGSGATCFGLFDDEATAIAAGTVISDRNRNWWVQATHFLR
ncbi:MAG: 4-(cytidine 5'-diphospho)-2-C-methyl-D-erythritol kinase [Alphaproteobacteria bacterium]|nr:4-(cytidine 5'-diphospho)-2-C-methyl-D-erythritol kinase [Alphaproteobacteria bacterium]